MFFIDCLTLLLLNGVTGFCLSRLTNFFLHIFALFLVLRFALLFIDGIIDSVTFLLLLLYALRLVGDRTRSVLDCCALLVALSLANLLCQSLALLVTRRFTLLLLDRIVHGRALGLVDGTALLLVNRFTLDVLEGRADVLVEVVADNLAGGRALLAADRLTLHLVDFLCDGSTLLLGPILALGLVDRGAHPVLHHATHLPEINV